MKIRFLVLVSIFVLFFSLCFFAAAETTEPESVSEVESTSFIVESSTESPSVSSTVPSTEPSTESSFGFSDNQDAILNRLDLIYTLGLFVVAVLAALLVVIILWRVLDVFI